jgi:hypothetical protein
MALIGAALLILVAAAIYLAGAADVLHGKRSGYSPRVLGWYAMHALAGAVAVWLLLAGR